ncbi:MAG: hypothetical protein Q9N68_05595, partial [Gammaproteobacteria bacterium]|nr:hypothetical protein [Gammaproteobacteria bacterium]
TPATPATPATGTTTPGNSANGQTLYAAGCANCHGGDPINNGLNVANGVSALVITSKHSFVVSADAVDLAAYISSRVGTATTPTTGASSGGAALYASKCAGCHGADPINNRQGIASGTSASEISKQHGTQYSSSAESTQIAAYISTRVLSSGGSAVDSISSASGDDDDDDEGFGGSTAPMLLVTLLGTALLRRRYL